MFRLSVLVAFTVFTVLLTGVSSIASAQSAQDRLAGSWLGALEIPGGKLRIVFHFSSEGENITATMDSPDQDVRGIPVGEVTLDGDKVSVDVPVVSGGFEGRLLSDGNSIEGKWKQGGMDMSLLLNRVDSVEGPRRPQEPQPPFPYDSHELGFTNSKDDVYLGGTLTLPRGEGPFPAVVLVSGSGAQDRDESIAGHRPFFVLADYLTRRGVAVLRYDDRGVGESTGNISESTTQDFAGDVLAAIATLSRRSDIDDSRIGIIGHSEGGVVAAIAAASSDEVAFIIMMAGTGLPGEAIILMQGEMILRANGATEEVITQSRSLQRRLFDIVQRVEDAKEGVEAVKRELRRHIDTLDAEVRAGMGIPENMVDAYIDMQAKQIYTPWFRNFLTLDPREWLRQVDIPVLALLGEKDLQVPAKVNFEAIEKALAEKRHPLSRVEILQGLNHLFQTAGSGSPNEYFTIEETIAELALDTMGEWLREVTETELD
jgi:uncharacterized protein